MHQIVKRDHQAPGVRIENQRWRAGIVVHAEDGTKEVTRENQVPGTDLGELERALLPEVPGPELPLRGEHEQCVRIGHVAHGASTFECLFRLCGKFNEVAGCIHENNGRPLIPKHAAFLPARIDQDAWCWCQFVRARRRRAGPRA